MQKWEHIQLKAIYNRLGDLRKVLAGIAPEYEVIGSYEGFEWQGDTLNGAIQRFEAEGWELVSIVAEWEKPSYVYYFKRQKNNARSSYMQEWEYKKIYSSRDEHQPFNVVKVYETYFGDAGKVVGSINTRRKTSKKEGETLEEAIHRSGREGWELITIDNGIYYFKRPL